MGDFHGHGWSGISPCVREFGEGKLSGIVNGIDYDEWSPDADEHLMSDGYTTLPDAKRIRWRKETVQTCVATRAWVTGG